MPLPGVNRRASAKPDAHVLAEIVRLDHAHHRQVAADSPLAEAGFTVYLIVAEA
jgi:hypothetical protein